MKRSASLSFRMSPGVGAKSWASTPGARRLATSVCSPPIRRAKYSSGNKVVTTERRSAETVATGASPDSGACHSGNGYNEHQQHSLT